MLRGKYKYYVILVVGIFIGVDGFSQSMNIDIDSKNITLKELFSEIEKQSDYSFFYKDEIVDTTRIDEVVFKDVDIKSVLKEVLTPYKLTFKIHDQIILIIRSKIEKELRGKKIEVTGTVTGVDGKSIPGVNILVKGTERGTITNVEGYYRLVLDDPRVTLSFSFIGFKTKEVKVRGKRNINVVLTESSIGIDEIIAIGYGVAKKSDLTGAISSIKAAKIQETTYTSIDQGLVGRAAGVNVTQSSGMPGAIAGIRIRGINSLEGGNEPLFVIDGFPVYNGTGYGNTGGNSRLSGLSLLNPSDIESIEILKDASATSIYGARATNGVVLITTMMAKEGQDKITLDAFYGIQSVVKKIDLMNAFQYAELVNEVQKNEGFAPIYDDEEMANIRDHGEGTDWQGELYRLAPIQKYQLRFSGGHKKTKYVVSGGYYNQDGIILNSGLKRLSARMNLDRRIRNNVQVGSFTTLSYSKSNNVKTDANLTSRGVVNSALKMNPVLPVYENDELGIYTPVNTPGTDFPNPVATANEQVVENKTIRLLSNAYGEWDIAKGLKAKFSLGADLFINKGDQYTPSFLYESPLGSGTIRTDWAFNWLNENTLTWNKKINEDQRLLILGGITFQENWNEGVLASSQDFVNDILAQNNLGAGAVYNQPQSGKSRWSLISYLGRINYNFSDKYLFSYNMRVDGSSRFGKNNKYAFFPSGALGWRLIEEDFVKKLNVFSNLKARISYGVTGNQEIGLYNSLPTLGNKNYTLGREIVTGFYPDKIPNPDLKWEKTAQFNMGFDLGFFKNRFTITADWYHKKTTDLIYSTSVPLVSGFSSSIDNVGSIQNKGWEVEMSGNIINRRFRWSSGINVSSNKSKVLELGGELFRDIETSGSDLFKTGNVHRLIVGKPIGIFYGYVFDGIFQDENELNIGPDGPTNWIGGQRYKDLGGPEGTTDGIIDAIYDRKIIGNPNPKFYGGITNTFFFEGFECNVFSQYSYGNDILNFNAIELELPSGNNNVYADLVNRWSPENPSNIYPRATKNRTVLLNDRLIEDGSYFKVKTVSLSYSFPNLQIKHLDRLKIYVTGQNLLTFTKYKGYDPEVNFRGVSNQEFGEDFGGYPQAKTVLLGVKLTLR